MKRISFLLVLTFAAAGAQSQSTPPSQPQAPAILPEPEVQSDHTVTFRFRDPNAKEVKLTLRARSPYPCKKMLAVSGV